MTDTNPLPPYNEAAGQAVLSSPPPFAFPGVTMRVFPLRANMHALTAFCDQYLNVVPPEVGRFRPSAPVVTFAMINYGKLASTISNMGWVAQNEVVFTVGLEWYKKCPETGEMVFHDWASCTPFLYVDSMSSLTTGREVYGWPKVAAELVAEIDPWTKSPRKHRRVMCLSAMLFGEIFAGQRETRQKLIEVHQEASPTFTQVLPRWDNPLNPFYSVPRMVRGAMTLAGDAMQMAMRSPLQGYGAPPSPDSLRAMLRRVLGNAKPFTPELYNNTINLKQFRYADNPKEVCYQALTCSKMITRRINAGGLLGDMSLARGHPSGGFHVKIHRTEQQPIIETLGLEVSEESETGGMSVATIRPMVPFWLDMDMSYGRGKPLVWQTQDIDWVTTSTPTYYPDTDADKDYNTTCGAAVQEVSGPHTFPNTVVRVLPLMAKKENLDAFVDGYLGTAGELVFEAWGSKVYMLVQNFDQQASATMNIGRFADKAVTFYIPVRVTRKSDGELITCGLVSPFSYSNTNLGAISGREINGYTTLEADIVSPPGGWLSSDGPGRDVKELMSLRTDVQAALFLGQEVTREELIRVIRGPLPVPESDGETWREVAADWGPRLAEDFKAKHDLEKHNRLPFEDMHALALEILAPGDTNCGINEFTLKQFRDSYYPGKACYQAIVKNGYVVNCCHDVQEIEEPMHVGIHRYPSQDLVEVLGLHVKWEDVSGAQPLRWLEPIRPFWAKLNMQTKLPHEMMYRTGLDGAWRTFRHAGRAPDPNPIEVGYFSTPAPHISVGRGLVKEIDDQEADLAKGVEEMQAWIEALKEGRSPGETTFLRPDFWADMTSQPDWVPVVISRKRRELQQAKTLWRKHNKEESDLLTPQQAVAAVDAIVEPQAIIESILSREWGNWGLPRWLRNYRKVLDEYLLVRRLAGDTKGQVLDILAKLVENTDAFRGAGEVAQEGLKNQLASAPRRLAELRDPETLKALIGDRKPHFYIRDDSLGPCGETLRRELGLKREDFYWTDRGDADERDTLSFGLLILLAIEEKRLEEARARKDEGEH